MDTQVPPELLRLLSSARSHAIVNSREVPMFENIPEISNEFGEFCRAYADLITSNSQVRRRTERIQRWVEGGCPPVNCANVFSLESVMVDLISFIRSSHDLSSLSESDPLFKGHALIKEFHSVLRSYSHENCMPSSFEGIPLPENSDLLSEVLFSQGEVSDEVNS